MPHLCGNWVLVCVCVHRTNVFELVGMVGALNMSELLLVGTRSGNAAETDGRRARMLVNQTRFVCQLDPATIFHRIQQFISVRTFPPPPLLPISRHVRSSLFLGHCIPLLTYIMCVWCVWCVMCVCSSSLAWKHGWTRRGRADCASSKWSAAARWDCFASAFKSLHWRTASTSSTSQKAIRYVHHLSIYLSIVCDCNGEINYLIYESVCLSVCLCLSLSVCVVCSVCVLLREREREERRGARERKS